MKGRILVVEDEKTALQALSLLLADEGYEILKAQTGEQGHKLDPAARPRPGPARHPASRRRWADHSREAACRSLRCRSDRYDG